MRYRVAWHSNVTGRNGEDDWKDDKDLVEADLLIQRRRWSPELELRLEVMDDNGNIKKVEESEAER